MSAWARGCVGASAWVCGGGEGLTGHYPHVATAQCTPPNTDHNSQQVAVLDEVQMLADPARGAAWTRALLGMPVRELHVCGDPAVLGLLQALAAQCGDELQVGGGAGDGVSRRGEVVVLVLELGEGGRGWPAGACPCHVDCTCNVLPCGAPGVHCPAKRLLWQAKATAARGTHSLRVPIRCMARRRSRPTATPFTLMSSLICALLSTPLSTLLSVLLSALLLQVMRYRRLNPLVVAADAVALSDLQHGDAVVAFSRR